MGYKECQSYGGLFHNYKSLSFVPDISKRNTRNIDNISEMF